MSIRGRTLLAAIAAGAVLLLFSAQSFPSSSGEAGRKYAVARERLAELRKSPARKKYRSYWMDCIRSFELIEKKYSDAPVAADACFDQADVYAELYRNYRTPRDLDLAIRTGGRCQSAHPRHTRAPEALYDAVVLCRDQKNDLAAAAKAAERLAAAYPKSDWTRKAKALLARNGNGRAAKRETELRSMPVPVITSPQAAAGRGTVKSIRYRSGENYTRIVIDQDRPLKFQATELKNPDRLVFDILNARADDAISTEPITVNDGILRQVRTGQHASDIVRIVLDLASLQSYAAFPLPDPDRLVIDITGGAPQQTGQGNTPSPAGQPPQAAQPPPAATEEGDGKLSLSRQLGLKIRTIAIDAGHGGKDPGAIGRSGLQEKVVTLDIARRLAALVKDRLGMNIVLTRDRDVFIPLEDRPAIARTRGADLFVSIHVNANRKRNAKGIETYIQSLRATDKDAMATAAFENATSTRTLSQLGSELSRILKDLRTDDKQEESLTLAHAVQNSLVDSAKPVQARVVDLGVKRAFFYVLINTEMPSILAEVGFISNPDEEKMLRKESYRQSIAEALFRGIKHYVESRNPQVAAR